MQTVNAAFTAEEKDSVRYISHNLNVSWKKFSTLGNRTFTIGVSTIGGNDVIGINPGAIGSPANYKYFDESAYAQALAWERGLKMPVGGLAKSYAEAVLDNTSGRFTPRYMGGSSELFTAVLPRRPFTISAGFDVGGVDITIPQFAGILDRQPEVDLRSKTVRLHGSDYIDFFYNRFLDQEVMFTGQTVDQIYTTLFNSLGVSTAQYELDYGINPIPFGLFEKGTRYAHIFHQLAEAENGHFYQDEEGIFRFENRQHWDGSPHNSVSKIIFTGQVIEAKAPDDDHLINVVEIKSKNWQKQVEQLIWKLSSPIGLPSGNTELFIEFDSPVLAANTPSFIVANLAQDESGSDISTSISIKSFSLFAKTAKIVFYNSTVNGFLTQLSIYGRVARPIEDIYIRSQDDSSVTAFEERVLQIENPYIQSLDWAKSFAQTILEDFSDIENLQQVTIRALPELQLGDLVSWQGRYWRIFDIKARISASDGFLQELTLLQRTINTYFRIGISTIGGSDKIAP